jgi:hypothetical protein
MGLHGAAITHGVFMKPGSISLELKTLYAYEANLFGLIAESRFGVHAQVDIRKYFVPGGQKPIDESLITRVMQALDATLVMQSNLGLTQSDVIQDVYFNRSQELTLPGPMGLSSHVKCQEDNLLTVITEVPGDFVIGPTCSPQVLNHVLGPKRENQSAVCAQLMFAKIRQRLKIQHEESFHCHICTPFVG